MTDFVGWNVQKGQHRKNLLSSSLLCRDNCGSTNENYLKLTSKLRKNPKFSTFHSFYAGFVKFMTYFVDRKGAKCQQGTSLFSSRLF